MLGLLAPGSDGKDRIDGELLPHGVLTLGPDHPAKAAVVIVGAMARA